MIFSDEIIVTDAWRPHKNMFSWGRMATLTNILWHGETFVTQKKKKSQITYHTQIKYSQISKPFIENATNHLTSSNPKNILPRPSRKRPKWEGKPLKLEKWCYWYFIDCSMSSNVAHDKHELLWTLSCLPAAPL